MTIGVSSPGWIALTIDRMPPAVRLTLTETHFEANALKQWIREEFQRQVGFSAEGLSSDCERQITAQKWWAFQFEHGDVAFRKHPVLQSTLFGTLSEKVSTIAQRSCAVCANGAALNDQFPRFTIPFRIPPQSRQSLNSMHWQAFQRAIRARLTRSSLADFKPSSLCVAITFALTRYRQDRDLDNMAKAIIDAISRACGFDDGIIHHLDLVKLIENFEEEYLVVRLAPSHLSDNSNVFFLRSNLRWDQPILDLADFLL